MFRLRAGCKAPTVTMRCGCRAWAAVAGEMSIDGVVGDPKAFDPEHQGFNLLNVKYLFRERRGPLEPGRGIFHEEYLSAMSRSTSISARTSIVK